MSQGHDDNADDRIPPSTFHLGVGGFRPTVDYQPIPGLADTVRQLQAQGRLRSALNATLAAIDAHPSHPEPLILAMMVASTGRAGRLQAVEPFTDTDLLDPRLDPIFTVCSQCQRISWVSRNCLMPYGEQMIMNPIGVQCYHCGFVVCRNCLRGIWEYVGDVGRMSSPCPNCQQPELGVPVYPTGRVSQQMARSRTPVIAVLFFREGPIPPDADYLQTQLEFVSPDIFEGDRPLIKADPVQPWPDEIRLLALAVLTRLERDGVLPAGSLDNHQLVQGRDRAESRICIVKVAQPSR